MTYLKKAGYTDVIDQMCVKLHTLGCMCPNIYWSPKTMKWRPYWCLKCILWDFSSILIQTFPTVLALQYGRQTHK